MADQVDTSNIDSRMARELFKEYVEAKKAQGEKVDMTYGDLVKKLADQMPRLEQRLGGPVRFQVARIEGKVRLRARKVDGAKSNAAPSASKASAPKPASVPPSAPPAKKDASKPPPIAKSPTPVKPPPASKPEPVAVVPPPVAASPEFEDEAEVEIPDFDNVDAAAEELYVGLTGHYATVQAAQALADYETERIKVKSERPTTEPTTTSGLSGRWHTIEKVEEKRGIGGIVAIAAILVVVLGGGLYAADRYAGALGGALGGGARSNVANTKPPVDEKASEPLKAEPEPAEPAEPAEEAGVRSLEVEAADSTVAAAGPEEDAAETEKTEKAEKAEKAPEPPKVAKAKPKVKKTKPKPPEGGPPEAKAEGTDAAPAETAKAEPPPEQPPPEAKAPPPATPG